MTRGFPDIMRKTVVTETKITGVVLDEQQNETGISFEINFPADMQHLKAMEHVIAQLQTVHHVLLKQNIRKVH